MTNEENKEMKDVSAEDTEATEAEVKEEQAAEGRGFRDPGAASVRPLLHDHSANPLPNRNQPDDGKRPV